jgi:GT2 family glycosyltransferase
MSLSVIVPAFNAGEDLVRCLRALVASERPPDEIIVVDDGSTDDSVACAGGFGARVLATQSGPRGPAHARNCAARVATGDILVFIDADVAVHADTLGRMESVFVAAPEVDALFGSYDDAPPARGIASRYKNLQHHYVHQHGSADAGTFWAGCGAIRREIFLEMGGFDEFYRRPSIEDIELGLRLRKANRRIRLCRDIQATHRKRWTLWNLWRTDICARAIPWSRLILRQSQLPTDLNLDWRSRWSAAAVWLMSGLVVLALVAFFTGADSWVPGTAGAAVGVGLLALALNRDLYRFFHRRGGVVFAAVAVLLHFTYLLYSSAIFAALWAGQKLGRAGDAP